MEEGERRNSDTLNGEPLCDTTPATLQDSSVSGGDIESKYAVVIKDPQNIEKMTPVDRRKLEQLIVAGGKDNETADEYFQRVMESTGTVILWPSKLKIGAKSKKDPQVKIAGPLESVNKARDILLSDLDTKTNRVTLKINVAFGEHSHVIGREGANIRKVQDETQCHIHFPDSNRYTHGEKSDQVSVTGLYPAVEIARKRVRELQPIVVSLSLPLPAHVTVDHNSPDMVQIGQTYNVNIHIKPQPQTISMMITIKGTMKFIDGVKLTVVKLVEYFTGDLQHLPPVSLYVDIAQQHHRTIMGREGGNIQRIMHDTCTTIQLPEAHSRYHNSQVVISGPLDSVIEARQQLVGCLPVALLFDVLDEGENITSSLTGELMQSFDVFLSIKPKTKRMTQSVIIKSIEQNMECVYEARRKLFDISFSTHHSHTPPNPSFDLNIEPSFDLNGSISVSTDENVDVGIMKKGQVSTPTDVDIKPVLPTSSTVVTPTIPSTTCVSIPEVEVTDIAPTSSSQGPIPSPDSVQIFKPQSYSQDSLSVSQSRLTVKAHLDYDKKRKDAEIALKTKVDPNVKRHPTSVFSGDYFSYSMPPLKDVSTVPGPVAKGLESLNKSGYQALMTQATMERREAITQEQNEYERIKDLSTLLKHLGLEKYESNFTEEEVDFETFLTMSEDDLKEVGVSKLGARRKLQLAILEIKKIQQEAKKQSRKPSVPVLSINKSSRQPGGVKLAPGYMSRSVRF